VEGKLEPGQLGGPAGYSTVIELILFTTVGVGLLTGFLALSFQGPRRKVLEASVMTTAGEMVRLEGLAFINGAGLLDDAEYRLLCSNIYLQGVAKRFRKERQELAIIWISMLQTDLRTLLRFHRFLISRGASSRFQEELEILGTYVASVVLLSMLKTSIYTVGPFALCRVNRCVRGLVDRMSKTTAQTLSRIPAVGWPELERSWGSALA
jgi:hypothetical protein